MSDLTFPTNSPVLNGYQASNSLQFPGSAPVLNNYQSPSGDQAATLSQSEQAASPVATLSSSNGNTTIDNHIADHSKDMTALAGATPAPTPTPTPTTTSGTVDTSLKAQGGLSLDEVNASGVDTTNYTYDPKTKYFLPKTAGTTDNGGAQYQTDVNTINDAFKNQVGSMDAATQALMDSIKGIYSSRIADQQEANRRELGTFDTMNTRFGTSRYAPGVATGVLTADERVGLDRINKIAQEEAGLLAQANQSLTDKKYSAFVEQRNELNNLRKERIDTLQKLKDDAYKTQQDKITNDLNAKIHSDTVSYQDKQLAIQNSTLAENIRKDKAAELQKAADLKVKQDAAKLLQGAFESPVTKNNGVVNPADQQKFLSQYAPDMQTIIKGVADYSLDPNAASKRAGAGFSPIQLEALAKGYNPDYKSGNYKAISSFLTSWASGGNNSVVQSANTAIQHFGELANFADKLGNAPAGSLGAFTSKYNNIKQWINEGSQDSNVLNFKQTAVLAATEMAKLVKNGSGSNAAPGEDEIKAQLETLSAGLSPTTARDVIGNDIELLKDRLNTARENYSQVVGSDPGQILYPSATQTLKDLQNKGYQIDVSSLNPSALSNVSDSDLVSGIVSPSATASTPSAYFSSLLNLINQPAPTDTSSPIQ